jgi:hypothetical protein
MPDAVHTPVDTGAACSLSSAGLFGSSAAQSQLTGAGGARQPNCPERHPLPCADTSSLLRLPHAHHPERGIRCNTASVTRVQNNGRATGRGSGGVTGRGFMPGQSGNPSGRARGLSRSVRELVGEDGRLLAELWWSIARDESRRDSDRLRASELLADRGWGKAPAFEPLEGNAFDLADAEAAGRSSRQRFCGLPRPESSRTSRAGRYNPLPNRCGPPERPLGRQPCGSGVGWRGRLSAGLGGET